MAHWKFRHFSSNSYATHLQKNIFSFNVLNNNKKWPVMYLYGGKILRPNIHTSLKTGILSYIRYRIFCYLISPIQNTSVSIFMCWFLAVPLASGQVHSSTSHSVTHGVTESLSHSVRKLKISVNIDARTLKFGMEHPWAYWLKFRKNQFDGPCEDHVLAIKGPYFGHF